jgi:3-hydroxyacyl-CoA dehydrogenase
LLNRIQWAMSREASRLWAEGVATAQDIELGITTTFGFRIPHEGPLKHYDLAGIWKWPEDVRNPGSGLIARLARSLGVQRCYTLKQWEKAQLAESEGQASPSD